MLDLHMPAQHDRIGHDDTIFDEAIVGNVRVGHQIAVVADASDSFIFLSTAIHGDAFAEDIAVSDDDLGRRSLVGQILRFAADHASRKEAVVSANGGMTGDGDIVFETCATPDLGICADDTMMSDANIVIEFGAGIYHSGVGYDCWHGSLPRLSVNLVRKT